MFPIAKKGLCLHLATTKNRDLNTPIDEESL